MRKAWKLLLIPVLFPLWLCFSRAICYVGFKFMRNRRGALELPVVYFENDAGRSIIVINVIHFADAQYYATLQKLIDSLEGYAVLFEGTGTLTPEQKESLSPSEKVVSGEFDKLFEVLKVLSGILELKGQKEGLTYPSTWVRTDMPIRELIRRFAAEDLHIVSNDMPSITKLLNSEGDRKIVRWFVNRMFAKFPAHAVLLGAFALFSKKKRAMKRIILDERNTFAFEGIQEQSGNVVTIWGAAHFRGIEKHLKRAGFRAIRKDWYPAYRVRKYGILGELQSIGKELKQRRELEAVLKQLKERGALKDDIE